MRVALLGGLQAACRSVTSACRRPASGSKAAIGTWATARCSLVLVVPALGLLARWPRRRPADLGEEPAGSLVGAETAGEGGSWGSSQASKTAPIPHQTNAAALFPGGWIPPPLEQAGPEPVFLGAFLSVSWETEGTIPG